MEKKVTMKVMILGRINETDKKDYSFLYSSYYYDISIFL